MPSNECIAFYDPGDDLNGVASATVTGSRFIKVSGDKKDGSLGLASNTDGGRVPVAPCGAGEKAIGVAAYDTASGSGVPIIRGHKVVPVTAGAAMTAGDEVMSDATGRAITWTSAASEANRRLGVVLNSPSAAGQTAIVALDL